MRAQRPSGNQSQGQQQANVNLNAIIANALSGVGNMQQFMQNMPDLNHLIQMSQNTAAQ
jgi:hypothetical protein